MPLYTCIADHRTSREQRATIAAAITEAHCRLTGAPAEFVHVIFNEYLAGSRKAQLCIVGSIRRGRNPALRRELHDEIQSRSAQILAVPPHRVRVTLQEVRAEWAMEGGEVLPEPGTEDQWMDEHWKQA